jgi:predicted nucleotidyltransferase
MSIELDVLVETYTILKQYIQVKDRQEAADNLMSILVDLLDDQSLKEFGGSDSNLIRALKEYAGDSIDDEDENNDFED